MTPDQARAAGVLTRDGKGGELLQVHVQPGAKRTEIVGLHGDRLKVRLAAPPIEGRANEALVEWVAEWMGVARAAVALVRGATSRQKTVRIATT